MRRMHLHAVKSGFLNRFGGKNKCVNRRVDLGDGQGNRRAEPAIAHFEADMRRRFRPAVDHFLGLAACMVQLRPDLCAMRFRRFRQIRKRCRCPVRLRPLNGEVAAAFQMPAVNQNVAGDQQSRPARAPAAVEFGKPRIGVIVSAGQALRH